MTPNVAVVAPDQFVETAATTIAELIGEAIAARGACSLALCGGSTPAPVYQEIATRSIDWSCVSIYFGDERAVPSGSPDSNFAMASHTLLDLVVIPPSQVHRMTAECTDLDRSAREYDSLLPPRFDVLLLGVGPDGHTASLFPGGSGVAEPWRRVVAVAAPPFPLAPPVARLTITPLVIVAARHVVVMVRGTNKAAIVQRILEGPDQPAMLPAQYARRGTWIIDQAAGAQLQSRDN